MKSQDIDGIYEYYQRKPIELAKAIINSENLSEIEIDRLIYEAGPNKLKILQTTLQKTHPILQKIERTCISEKDI